MKTQIRLITLCAVCAFFLYAPASAADAPLDLATCMRLALKQSETVASSREKIREAQGRFTRALGTILPHASFERNEYLQDTAGQAAYKTRLYDQKFVFKQTLFSGFKEFAGMSGSRSEVKQRTLETKRASDLLFVDVADAFYLLLELRKDIEALAVTAQALDDRIAELKNRVQVGKSRMSEIASTEVQLYSTEAELNLAKNQEIVARDLLEFLIGQPVTEITDETADVAIEKEPSYVKGASLRPDVEATRYAWEADLKKAYVAKTGFLPSVNLEGNYYTHKNTDPEEGKWDALLTVSVPIFEGTETFGAVKEANAVAKQSELAYQRVIRAALQDIHDSYSLVSAALDRTAALTKALQAAEQNYQLQQDDYRLNLVNNLDVLSAIQTLQDTRRNYYNAYYEARRYYWQLRAASGNLPQEKKQ
ncbi:MAG TPA: TolC family protein [Patescibacteria group bacterium]|nr:TolC family protein [Patescibacteria group bacterium]